MFHYGLLVLGSASSYYALNLTNNSNHFWMRQAFFAVIGIVGMYFISKIDYKKYKNMSYVLYFISLVLMILVLVPGLGVSVKGATRWLGIGDFKFQPSEIMKVALVFASATYMTKNFSKIKGIMGCIPILGMFILVAGVMALQDHLSGTVVMAIAIISVIFSSGIKLNFKAIAIVIGILAVILTSFIFLDCVEKVEGEYKFTPSFRLKRITAFLHPEEDIRGTNWQSAQSLYAIGTGGIFGLGFGNSRQKYLWLPEMQNDFIFSVWAEETGLIGTVSLILLFLFFIYKGYSIAMRCNDVFGSLLASGITSIFALQIIVNIAVVTSSMPVTGMPLPFFSYGGTALVINLASMGVLLNISRNCK